MRPLGASGARYEGQTTLWTKGSDAMLERYGQPTSMQRDPGQLIPGSAKGWQPLLYRQQEGHQLVATRPLYLCPAHSRQSSPDARAFGLASIC